MASPELAASLLALRPHLAEHACHGSVSGRFGERIVGALLPHVVEHLAVDLLVEQFSGPEAQVFAGTTTWVDRETSRMRVRVGSALKSSSEQLDAAKAALVEAVRLINFLLIDDKNAK